MANSDEEGRLRTVTTAHYWTLIHRTMIEAKTAMMAESVASCRFEYGSADAEALSREPPAVALDKVAVAERGLAPPHHLVELEAPIGCQPLQPRAQPLPWLVKLPRAAECRL